MNKTITKFTFLICFIIFSTNLLALDWEYCEGMDGYKTNIFEFENTLYETNFNHKSTDNGKTWSLSTYPIYDSINKKTVFFPINFNSFFKYKNMYLGFGSRFYKSNDMKHWNSFQVFEDKDNYNINKVMVKDSLILFRVEKYISGMKNYFTFFSIDTGNSVFKPKTDIPNYEIVNDYTFNNSTIYATCNLRNRYYVSTDNGMNWVCDSIPNIPEKINYIKIIKNKLFILGESNIWSSEDSGKSWKKVEYNDLVNPSSRTFILEDGELIITNSILNNEYILIASSDKSKSWFRYGTSNFQVLSLNKIDSFLIAGTKNGVKISSDNGITWIESNNGLYVPNTNNLITVSNNYLANHTNQLLPNRILSSKNNGKTWNQMIIDSAFEKTMVLNQSYSNYYYKIYQNLLGTYVRNSLANVYKLNSNENKWEFIDKFRTVVFTNPNNLYKRKDSIFYFDEIYRYLFILNQNCTELKLLDSNYQERIPKGGLHLGISCGIHYSIDSLSNIYISTNSGKSWIIRSKLPASQKECSMKAIDENNFYWSVLKSGKRFTYYMSQDSGATVNLLSVPDSSTTIDKFIILKNNYYILLHKDTHISNIYKSTNMGKNWEIISDNWGEKFITDFFILDDFIFISHKEGMYRANLNEVSVNEESEENEEAEVEILKSVQIYPVPTKEILYIDNAGYELKSIRIFDSMGRLILNEDLNENSINISTLKSGVYLAQIFFEGNWYLRRKFVKY